MRQAAAHDGLHPSTVATPMVPIRHGRMTPGRRGRKTMRHLHDGLRPSMLAARPPSHADRPSGPPSSFAKVPPKNRRPMSRAGPSGKSTGCCNSFWLQTGGRPSLQRQWAFLQGLLHHPRRGEGPNPCLLCSSNSTPAANDPSCRHRCRLPSEKSPGNCRPSRPQPSDSHRPAQASPAPPGPLRRGAGGCGCVLPGRSSCASWRTTTGLSKGKHHAQPNRARMNGR
mmetsp:Transcript_83949/g.271281  ORF Transcript_83949/g.271281 Transcript_83949/m.271281 type:complete len:226 (-) Transcript_83949:46-723(-)